MAESLTVFAKGLCVSDATVVRIWRTTIDPARAGEYDEFARTRSVPMFRAQPGFVGVFFARRGPQRAVITLWRGDSAPEALAKSATYQAIVAEIEATGFLDGESSVELYDVDEYVEADPFDLHSVPGETGSAGSVRASYNTLAGEYSARIFHELQGKPLDRALLDEIAVRADGLVCDLGCGPGHVARYLSERSAAVCGIDLSPGMIGEARRLNPGLRFEVGDMRSLKFDDGSFAAVVAMYSLIHFTRDELLLVCKEITRVLSPSGLLLTGFHRGSEKVHVDELWGYEVNLDFQHFEPEEVTRTLAASGLEVERVVARGPYPGVEVETPRFYVLAVKPDHRRALS